MACAAVLLVSRPTLAAPTETAPQPSPATSTDMTMGEGYLADQQGHRQDVFRVSDTGVFLYLFFKNNFPSLPQQHELRVQAFTSDGKTYGRPLGGHFSVAAGEDLSARDFPRSIDGSGHNGWLIKGENLANQPGDYRVEVELDGRKMTELYFRVLSTGDELKLVSTFLANAAGKQKEDFTPVDEAVYVYAFFQNLDAGKVQLHRFRATFYDPRGAQFGRVLGGDFKVQPGDDLARTDFPRSSDPQKHNGFFIEKSLTQGDVGVYKVVLELDNHVVAELKYRLRGAAASRPR